MKKTIHLFEFSIKYNKAIRNFNIALFCVVVNISVGGCSDQRDALFSGTEAYELAERQMEFGDRIPGTEPHRQTGEWIRSELEESNWLTATQEFDYLGVQLNNIIGKSDERNSPGPIIVGAHYDTRPHADLDDLNPESPVPGANDGASGVAVLLELARVLDLEKSKCPVWLVFFDAEDSGGINGWDWIVGSSYFVDQITEEPAAVVIVDMVGDADLKLFYERNSTRELAEAIWQIAIDLGYSSFIPSERHSIIDDHTPFIQAGIPAVDIIDFDYPSWHTTNDTMDMISAFSLEQVGRTLEHWIEQSSAGYCE
jgi:Zn-dependent M28 family amino/carboxypeptidase